MMLRLGLFQKKQEEQVPYWLKGVNLPVRKMAKIAGVSDPRDLQLERPSDVSALRADQQYLGGSVPNATIDRLMINHMGRYLLEAVSSMGIDQPHVMYYRAASRQRGGSNAVISADYTLVFSDESGVRHTAVVRMSMYPGTGEIVPPKYLTTTAGQRLPFDPETFEGMKAPRYRGPSVYRQQEVYQFRPEDLDRHLFASRGPRRDDPRSSRRWGLYEGDSFDREAAVQPGHGLWEDLLETVPHDVGNIVESPEHDPDVERGELPLHTDSDPDYSDLDMDDEPQVDLLLGSPHTVTVRWPY
jgi:hypothetical protein